MAGKYEGAIIYPEIVIARHSESDVRTAGLTPYVGIALGDDTHQLWTAEDARLLASTGYVDEGVAAELLLHVRIAEITESCRDAAIAFAELGDTAPLEHALDHAFEEGLRDAGVPEAPSAELFDSVRDSAIFAGGMTTLGAEATGHSDPTAAGLAVMIATAYRSGLDANKNAPS